jgi:hypothetical protein
MSQESSTQQKPMVACMALVMTIQKSLQQAINPVKGGLGLILARTGRFGINRVSTLSYPFQKSSLPFTD